MMREFEFETKCMGSELTISIVSDNRERTESLFRAMHELAKAYDSRFSRFSPTSELTVLNDAGGGVASPEFLEVALLGKQLYQETGGAFNPLVDIARFGYEDDIAELLGRDRAKKLVLTPYHLDCEAVHINSESCSVTLLPGQRLDVGGYLKGFVAERMADLARGEQGVIVNLGGDLYTRGVDEFGDSFRFEIEHPLHTDVPLSFTYEDGAVATSGSYRRRWLLAGKPFHHILDASGVKNPDTDIISATVLSSRGHGADAYATAALVLGSAAAEMLLGERGLEYVLVLSDGTIRHSKHVALTSPVAVSHYE